MRKRKRKEKEKKKKETLKNGNFGGTSSNLSYLSIRKLFMRASSLKKNDNTFKNHSINDEIVNVLDY